MVHNYLKTPLGTSLNNLALRRAADQIQLTGQSLPASVVSVSGAIVVVKFEVQSDYTLPNVTVPLMGCEYARPPIQPGCKGYVQAADAYLGGMTGLGGGVADLTQRANLTALVFCPIGNKDWAKVNGNVYTIYGPQGVTLRDEKNQSTFLLTPSSITMQAGGHKLVIDSNGITLDGVRFAPHSHSGVQGGTGNTGPVVS